MKFFCFLLFLLGIIESVFEQVDGQFDFGQNHNGELRGELGPAAIAGVIFGALAVLMALLVTVYFCYHTTVNATDSYVDDNYRNIKYQSTATSN